MANGWDGAGEIMAYVWEGAGDAYKLLGKSQNNVHKRSKNEGENDGMSAISLAKCRETVGLLS